MVNKVYLVTPRGFCAGVEMAIKALHWLLKIYDETIYCYHEIVHNKWIVNEFQNKNVVFVEIQMKFHKMLLLCCLLMALHQSNKNFKVNLL